MHKYLKIIIALLLPFGCISMIALIFVNPNIAKESAANACHICITSIIPSLLPFFILSSIVINSGTAEIIGNMFKHIIKIVFNLPEICCFPIIIGYFSGYPTGAKMTCSLLEKKLISRSQAEHLIFVTNNPSPIFIISVIGTAVSSNSAIGYKLVFVQILTSILVGSLVGQINRFKKVKFKSSANTKCNSLKTSIKFATNKIQKYGYQIIISSFYDSMLGILSVCCYIIFFTVLSKLLVHNLTPYLNSILTSILAASIEFSTGILSLVQNYEASKLLFAIISAVLSFGGLSIYMQISSIAFSNRVSLKPYLKYKLFQALLAFLTCYIIF